MRSDKLRLQDILAHQYFRIDLEVIWSTVNNRLPLLKKTAQEMLLSLSENL